MLAVSITAFSLIIRELPLSSLVRESQIAFYAADSGAECALYWDIKHPGLQQSAFSTTTSSSITCAEQTSTVGGGGDSNPTSKFIFTLKNGAFVEVWVTKEYESGELITTIVSRGYNTEPGINLLRRVERGLRIVY